APSRCPQLRRGWRAAEEASGRGGGTADPLQGSQGSSRRSPRTRVGVFEAGRRRGGVMGRWGGTAHLDEDDAVQLPEEPSQSLRGGLRRRQEPPGPSPARRTRLPLYRWV